MMFNRFNNFSLRRNQLNKRRRTRPSTFHLQLEERRLLANSLSLDTGGAALGDIDAHVVEDICFLRDGDSHSRSLVAPNLTVVDAYLIDGNFDRITSPAIGEKVAVLVQWDTTDLSISTSYQMGFYVDGVELIGGVTSAGAGIPNGSGYQWYHTGWYAHGSLQNVTVIADVFDQVSESDESDNTFNFSFQATQPSDLPQKLIMPIRDELYSEVMLTNYHDVDPTSGIGDYAGGESSYNGHNAYDFGPLQFTYQDAGVELLAAADATVISIHDGEFDRNTEWVNGAVGNHVILDHGNGWQTIYWHLRKDSVRVSVGDTVSQGDVLGYMGSSGISTGLHVHFGLNHHGRHVETMYDSAAYFIDPVADVFDQPYVTESVVTNHISTNDGKEGASRVHAFDQSPNQSMSVMAVFSGGQMGDLIEYTWVRPNGSDYTTGSFNLSRDYSSSWWWFTRTLPSTPDLGTWTVDIKLNGALLKQESFEVTVEGAPEMRIDDDQGDLVVDDRYTPIEFATRNLGATPTNKTFTVYNHGSAELTLGDVRLPDRFDLVEGLDASIPAGGSDTFTVALKTDVAGNHAGEVSISTNDSDEPIYNFSVEGYVAGGGSQLILGVSERRMDEGTNFVANVRRPGNTAGDLTVSLSSSDGSEVSMPASVTIPAGDDYASFQISTLNDSDSDGPQTVNLFAMASGFADASNTLQVLDVDSAGPSVDNILFADGSGQRSMVQSINIDFDRQVTIDDGAFELLNSSGDIVDVSFTTLVQGGVTQAVLSFSGSLVESSGSLEDGNYELTILGDRIRDFAGDSVGADSSESFHRLYGDFDGTANVDIFDLLTFRQTYRSMDGDTNFNAAADFNVDGNIDIFDLLAFRQRYRTSI